MTNGSATQFEHHVQVDRDGGFTRRDRGGLVHRRTGRHGAHHRHRAETAIAVLGDADDAAHLQAQ